ncbi:MAG: PqqD family protein [Candidatus Binataceae bacterium]
MVVSFADRVTASPDVMFRTVGDEAVLLNLKTELYLGLDPVGSRMWDLLTKSASIERAFIALLSEYDVENNRLRGDLEEFLNKLLAQGLIEVSPGQPS